jgi:hypothetical protein
MKLSSLVKIVLVAGAVALPSSFSTASAKMQLPPGACLSQKKVVAAGALCSYNCDPKSQWCSQQLCVNGVLTAVLPCYSGFCSAKCG